jgi:hypothetical protein
MIKKCEVCGAEYLSNYTQSKYCAACRIEVKREQDREHEKQRVRDWRNGDYHMIAKQTVNSAKKAGCTVEEIVRRAAAAGMTYGQYVAKMEGHK